MYFFDLPLCTIFISSADAVQEFCFRIYQPHPKPAHPNPAFSEHQILRPTLSYADVEKANE